MFLHELRQSVSTLRGAGPSVVSRLGRLGITTIADLLTHYPRDYEDRSSFRSFSHFADGGSIHTAAIVTAHEWFGFGRMKTLKILVRDESSEAALICFNRPFLEKTLPIGAKVVVHGKFQFRYGEIQSSSFDAERLAEGANPITGLVPVYPLTEGLAQGIMRKLIRAAIEMYGCRVEDEIDPAIIAERNLLSKAQALSFIHFPAAIAEREAALRTLAYEELFRFQLGIALRIRARRSQILPRKPSAGILAERLLQRLPFALTSDQTKVLAEIAADMDEPHPMARLLQGDVGSGKTIVALLAALRAVERGGQVAIMAPTELLARQHAATAAKLIEPLGVHLAFLSGNVDDAARPPLLEALAAGAIDIVIGTHALFSSDVVYKSLKFIVIDEQHRFGVMQRIALYKKGDIPDMLMMTATPIPRSLALTLFGDLAVSSIKNLPPGRKPVKTHLAKAGNESKVYDFVRNIIREGRQAFFVYPLIDQSTDQPDKASLKSAEEMAGRLATEIYPEFTVSLLHSRLKEEKKRRIMDDFVSGATKILVATTVVEVGVDVPNAAVMVIEHAERFGLSALHQLRGRIGRSEYQSYCFLIYSGDITEDAVRRLKALYDSSDGFALAEEDLRIRGPGELLGTAQSGALRLLIANPLRDFELLKLARTDAFAVVKDDPDFIKAGHGVYRRGLDSI
ncbi:MAG: ATP-dependent DNA helicase RecG [Candidatus Hydrogenedentales bacterium]